MALCFLCDRVAIPDEAMAEHMLTEHDLDLDAVVEKWPDGEWVVHDQTLEPEDFEP